MNTELKAQIQRIVNDVPRGCYFDSHFVIDELIKQPSEEFHRFCNRFLKTKGANAKIATQIGKCGVERIKGFSWSDTIRHKPGKCACWRQLSMSKQST
jgi:hypothetical protein